MNINKIKNKIVNIKTYLLSHRVILYSIICFLMLAIVYPVFSKYVMSINGVGSASIGKIYYSVDIIQSESAFENKKLTYYFNVNNYDSSNKLNEVLSKYYLKPIIPANEILDDVVFTKKMYYKNDSDEWVEIPVDTTGTYSNYFKGYENLQFSSRKTHSYKLEMEASKNLYVGVEQDFNIEIIVMQTLN